MSLVNDMLRDLASQHQGEPQIRGNGDTLLAESSLLKKNRRSWLPSVVAFAVVLVGLLLGQKVFLSQVKSSTDSNTTNKIAYAEVTPDSSADIVVQQAPFPVQMPAQIPVERATAVVNSDVVAVIAPVVARVAMVERKTNFETKATLENKAVVEDAAELERVYKLLQSAERALELDRLTSPIEDNAYRYYQQVLQLSPQNSFARAGMEAIAQRYVDLATEALAQSNRQRAETLLERAEFVVPGYAAIALLRQQMAEVTPRVIASSPDAELQSQLQMESKHKSSAPSVDPSTSVAMTSFAVAEANAGKISAVNAGKSGITRNAEWQDQQAAAQAEQLVNQGQTQAAQLFLQEFIAGHQQPVKATQALFTLYLQQPDQEAARLLLQEARNYLPEVLRTHLTAQLLFAQGSPAAAISVLEKDIQQAEGDEAYRALLAGLYHKTARYHESASSYRRLLDVFGEKPAYWLGLALALDALQQNASALEAYRRVPFGGALSVQVKDYVDQRILALSR